MSRHDRRAMLRLLGASPVLAAAGFGRSPGARADPSAQATSTPTAALPGTAADALDVFDLEAAAQRVVPPAHWGYLQSGVDGDRTLHANEAAYARYQLRPRRLVDVSHIELSTRLFGMSFASPVLCCPIGSLRAFHPDGDIAVARATKSQDALQILSTQASFSIEEVIAARGMPVWYQLYTTNRFDVTKRILKRVESAGCPVVAVTVDTPAGRNTVTAARLRREDTRTCSACHTVDEHGNPRLNLAAEPMFAGIDTRGLGLTSPALTWDFIKRVKDVTGMKVLLKGIETGEDTELAVEHGADGIIVSNHGGRALESGRATLDALPEVVRAAAGRVPVLVDGGVRRGTDVYKALALGASAVGIGRPYAWGLAAFGQAGVERVLEMLNRELRLAMAGCGARTIREISPNSLTH
ncbi:MAG TPA: alpha-hydroxy acid oxidase [Steroidobacteraceae bacterium]|nr:alpha-hydroxy acid oxidase [Steroidobacteraceae bacterium]